MDVLRSLQIEDLPEQQTRTLSIMEKEPDFEYRLGFDACCACGQKLVDTSTVDCPSCRRVSYCSEACRQQDAQVTAASIVSDEEETALGHSSIVCVLLNTCTDDEAVVDNKADELDGPRRQAALERVQSELESYPATLANILLEGGACYEPMLKRASENKTLVVHLIGASEEGELWEGDHGRAVLAYSDALAELSEKQHLDSIQLYLIGPECVEFEQSKSMRSYDKAVGELIVHAHKSLYTSDFLSEASIPVAGVVVFFNPGFTVPEYNWKDTLAAIRRGTPFLAATNTEMEAVADCQYLLEQDKIRSLPSGLADIFGLYSSPDDDDDEKSSEALSFLSTNPFCGSRVRQSGTMANDLFVKNRWILGGIMDSFDPSVKDSSPSKRSKTALENNKEGNPALI
jgi:hypothetical protein